MRGFVCLPLLCCLLAAVLTGCGQSTPTGQDVPPPAAETAAPDWDPAA